MQLNEPGELKQPRSEPPPEASAATPSEAPGSELPEFQRLAALPAWALRGAVARALIRELMYHWPRPSPAPSKAEGELIEVILLSVLQTGRNRFILGDGLLLLWAQRLAAAFGRDNDFFSMLYGVASFRGPEQSPNILLARRIESLFKLRSFGRRGTICVRHDLNSAESLDEERFYNQPLFPSALWQKISREFEAWVSGISAINSRLAVTLAALRSGEGVPWDSFREIVARWAEENGAPLPDAESGTSSSSAARGGGTFATVPPYTVHPSFESDVSPVIGAAPTPPAQDATRTEARAISDAPLDDDRADRLDFATYAAALSAIITNPETATPLTIAIHAPWGAGKTSLANLVKQRIIDSMQLEFDRRHVTCWFNAWLHDDAPNLATALAGRVAQVADEHRPWWRRIFNPLPTALRSAERQTRARFRRLAGSVILALAAAVAAVWVAPLWTESVIARIGEWLKAFASDDAAKLSAKLGIFSSLVLAIQGAQALLKHLWPVASSVAAYVRDPAGAAAGGALADVSRQLGELIRQATPGGGRFVVFIDDLERCQPPRPVDALEAVNQLLDHEGVVTVILADMAAVCATADLKYEKLAKIYHPTAMDPVAAQARGGSFGRAYVRKIIQLQFELPAIRRASAKEDEALLRAITQERPPTTWPSSDAARRTRRSLLSTIERARPVRGLLEVIRNPPADLRLPAWARVLWGIPISVWRQVPRLPLSRARRFAYAVIAAVIPTGFIWLAFRLLPRASPNGVSGLFVLAAFIVAIPWVFTPAGALLQVLERRREKRYRARREFELADRLAQTKLASPREQADAVLRQDPALLELDRQLIERNVERALLSDSKLLNAALEEMQPYRPPTLRSTKRILNHLRLSLFIADRRGMLKDDPRAVARRFGKWVTLTERWPELARVLSMRPALMRELETLAVAPPGEAVAQRPRREAALRKRVNELAGGLGEDHDLRALLATPTRLGDALVSLLTYTPLALAAAGAEGKREASSVS
ncbi:KAP family P-loop domain protein [Phycisphaerae bacterium RAS1]|nr:KAP family P-loop domain protein [Phycisphaerae bacterium RAS1]